MKSSVSVVALFGVFALAACATPQNNFAQNPANADRKIANSEVIESTTDRHPFDQKCGQGTSTSVSSNPGQVWLTSTKTSVYTYTTRTPIYACETTEVQGDGKGDWKGFYDQAGDKAEQLARAIAGVGYHPEKPAGHQGVAPYLVPYFQNQPKPRSWSAFAARITDSAQKIKNQYGLDPSWTGNVLVQNKAENMQRLGYLNSSGTDCSVTYEDKTYEVRTPISETSIPVELHVSGGKLLPGECETYSVSFDGTNVTGSTDSAFNKYESASDYDSLTADYSRNGRKVVVTMRATARIQTEAPYFIKGPATSSPISQNGGNATLTLSHPDYHALAAVSEFANACKVSATGSFYAKKGNGGNGKKDKATVQNVSVNLDMNSDTTPLSVTGIQISDPKKQHIGATVNQSMGSGCPFYAPGTKEVGKWD